MATDEPTNPAENPAALSVPEKVPQPHGGALYSGGVPGNRGGMLGGRPTSEVRKAARKAFDERIPMLAKIADSSERDSDRIKAIVALGNFGVGTLREMSTDDVREKLIQTIAILNANLSADDAERVLELMRPVWKTK
jgi:hypothetical protein